MKSYSLHSKVMMLKDSSTELMALTAAVQVFAPDEKIDSIDDRYWQVRAEPIPEEEMEPPQSTRRIHAYHVNPDATNNVSAPQPPLCALHVIHVNNFAGDSAGPWLTICARKFPILTCDMQSLTCCACMLSQVNFGHPFILQIGEEETLADIKPRIQASVLYLSRPLLLLRR